MSTQYQCPHCTGLFLIDPSMSGQQVSCPACAGLVTIDAAPAQSVAAATSQHACPHCAGLFQVDAAMAGQQVTCPSCRGLVTVPGATLPAGRVPTGVALPRTTTPAPTPTPPPQPGAAPPAATPAKSVRPAPASPPPVSPTVSPEPPRSTAPGQIAPTAKRSGHAKADRETAPTQRSTSPAVAEKPKSDRTATAADFPAPLASGEGSEAGTHGPDDLPEIFHDPVKTVGEGDEVRELQTLTRREKEGRRTVTSLIMVVVGFFILCATLFIVNMTSCVPFRLD